VVTISGASQFSAASLDRAAISYIAGDALAMALTVAIGLGRPLLLEGPADAALEGPLSARPRRSGTPRRRTAHHPEPTPEVQKSRKYFTADGTRSLTGDSGTPNFPEWTICADTRRSCGESVG
jgi:hypothetical protein